MMGPRVIAKEEELDKLPNGSVVLSHSYKGKDGSPFVFQRLYEGNWHRGGRSGSTHPDYFLPATVIHEPAVLG